MIFNAYPLSEGEGGQSHQVPGHSERGGSHTDLQHVRTLHRLQVRHQDPEDRQRLQSLHVGPAVRANRSS